ncbi:general substrate transporter [Diplocarpon rosae]|nr:general substrate transporter [Diplocarpon rosae]
MVPGTGNWILSDPHRSSDALGSHPFHWPFLSFRVAQIAQILCQEGEPRDNKPRFDSIPWTKGEIKLTQQELAEIVANNEYERSVITPGGYFKSWADCFTGSVFKQSSNLRRTILGTSLQNCKSEIAQMMQQWTGINFIIYFGTTFFMELGTISNPFLIGPITTFVNVCSTPISFYIIEIFGRRGVPWEC